MYKCGDCSEYGCREGDMERTMKICPSKDDDLKEESKKLYNNKENLNIAKSAAIVESQGYGRLCRMEEIILFCQKAGFKKIGLIFCSGLREEAKTVARILKSNGFNTVSAICKNGSIPKSHIGLKDEDTISGCKDEIMCNPIGQAIIMNKEETDFNILLGLCVGHDSLVLKYLEAPATVFAVKDRVMGHNPLAAIYLAKGYYKKKLFKE